MGVKNIPLRSSFYFMFSQGLSIILSTESCVSRHPCESGPHNSAVSFFGSLMLRNPFGSGNLPILTQQVLLQ